MADKLALVTGGRVRLGRAIATALAAAGYAIAIHSREEVGDEDPLPADWASFTADLRRPDAAGALVHRVRDQLGRAPDLVVNSASQFGQEDFDGADMATLHEHFAVNAFSPMMIAQSLARLRPERGCIVNILDQRIAQPHRDQFSYTMSKLALRDFTEVAARLLAPAIRVNAVAPGLTIPTADYSTARMRRAQAAMPLARLPTSSEIAAAVIYLAQAESVTGQILYVDGGAHLRSFDRDFLFD